MSCEIPVLPEEIDQFCWLCGGSQARATQLALLADDQIGLCRDCNARVLDHAEDTRAIGFGVLALVGGPIGTEARPPLASCGCALPVCDEGPNSGVFASGPREQPNHSQVRKAEEATTLDVVADVGRPVVDGKAG
jgi:hypothetical protein